MKRTICAGALSGLFFAGACGNAEPTAPEAGQAAPSAPEGPQAGAAAPPEASAAFPAQEGWIEETPSNPMRVAQFRLPAAEGDEQDASLVVFRFPGGAGGIEANFQRWALQFTQPDGRSSEEVATRTRDTRGDLTFHTLDVSGHYVAETMPGGGERMDEPGWRLLATIITRGEESLYVKLVGPEATVARWESSYRDFLGAVNP